MALGGTILVAHITPGHTRGCTTWTVRVRERGHGYDVVFIGSPSIPSEYKLVGNTRYPEIADDYRRTFATLKALPCDVFLGSHGSFFDLAEKMKRRDRKRNPFIDPAGYKTFVSGMEEAFEKKVRVMSHE